QKAGRDPAALAFSGDDAAADANSPASLALNSRIYRIVSEAEVSLPSSLSRRVRGRVEAVVDFAEDGDFRFRYWDFSTGPLEPAVEERAAEAETAAQDTSMDDADALENGAADEPAAEASPEDP